MKQLTCLVVVFLSLSGCVTTQLPQAKAVLVKGDLVVVRPAFTGWVRNWCIDSKPVLVRDQFGSESCIPFGGEIYQARLVEARVVGGERIHARRKVGFPGHAYLPGYEKSGYFVLLPSPENFRAATGILHLVGDAGDYDPVNACMTDRGYSHVGKGVCKDPAYHEKNVQHCVPLDEYLNHYSLGDQ